jgi:pseudoazurin
MKSWVAGCAVVIGASGSGSVVAAEVVVKMLNQGKSGPMAFEPAYLKVNVGDTVVFEPAEKGVHYAASTLVPAGAKPFKGPPDQVYKAKIEREGVYLYVCEPHATMGMVGVIQAGKPVNLADARAAATKSSASFVMGKDRFEKALALVK